MASAGTKPPYVPRLVSGAWVAALWAALAYGVFLTFTAMRLPPGSELIGQFALQPLFKALPALLLVVAAAAHPIVRERRWLMAALFFSAAGDFLLAIPSWDASFVAGLGSFLVAHLCFLGALRPLVRRPSSTRRGAAVLAGAVFVVMLMLFWPVMSREGVTVPVTIYIGVLCAMVCAALLARLPTVWTAVGAVCFAVSDGMIGTGRFVLESESLAVPIWWAYATSLVLITAGFFFGRSSGEHTTVSPSDASQPSVTPQG